MKTNKRLTKVMSTSRRFTKVKNHAYELKIHKSGADELKIHKSAYELKGCKIRSRVVRPNVITHSCNQLLRILHSNHGAHHASKAKHNMNSTSASKTANFLLFSVTSLF